MLKFQGFSQLKFDSQRLKKENYEIDITLDDARKNGEVISVTNSELIRTLFRLKNIEFSQKLLDSMLFERKKLRKLKNSEENRLKLSELSEKIEKMLFIEDFVIIEFQHKNHYLEILKLGGFYINGIRYTPFLASAGMIRKNTAMFVNNNIKYQLLKILDNGRNESTPIVTAKFGAYFSLYASSSLPVSFPRFAVIPDKKIETVRRVDFVTYRGENEDDDVEEKDYTLECNAFDGQGLISPRLALQWSRELELDYVFSNAIIRAPFLKGMVSVFDIHAFADEVSHQFEFTDVYGNTQDIREVDLIISESMFKLWNAYENLDEYISNCERNRLGFSITKINPENEKSYCKTSYQFLQVLNLTNSDIALLCQPTVDWFRNISGDNPVDMLLYATGENNFEPKLYLRADATTKAIILNPWLARDKYIQEKFTKTIEKKKKESYMGSIFLNGNYQFMVADPYYQAAQIWALDIPPLLKDGQHYSAYWNDKQVSTVAAIRSPIVHHSEVNILNLQAGDDVRKWYQYITSGIIFPAHGVGIDCVIHGGSDFDGDIICTINEPLIIKGRIPGLPIVYESQKVEKTVVDSRDDESMVKSQLVGYNSKVGFATNISSSFYTLLEEFPKGSVEYNTILKRLKIGRVIQGEIIDSVKGLNTPPFREHWTKYRHVDDSMSPEEKKKAEFNNRVLCEVRPAYFRFLYKHYMTRWNKEIKRYNIYSHLMFKKDFLEICLQPEKTEEEQKVITQYKWNSFFLDNNSVVNRLSRFMRARLGLLRRYISFMALDEGYVFLIDNELDLDFSLYKKMQDLLQEYKSFKRGLWSNPEDSVDNFDSFLAYIRKKAAAEISSNDSELATYAVMVTYGQEVSSVEFPWKVFPAGMVQNIILNAKEPFQIPVFDPNGSIEYLWNRYSLREYSLEEINGE